MITIHLTERMVRILTGLISLVFIGSMSVFGVKVAAGALQPVYHVEGTFSGAGQGLIKDSDVKVHGVNIGQVKSVKLVDGEARVRMEIDSKEKIPVDAHAVIRPKTLFGEKFVDIDPGEHEANGPFMVDEDEFAPGHTLGGFELERVLAEAFPILQAIDPAELNTILSTLAGAADGTGDEVNRQITNFGKVAAVSSAHDADTRQFLADLALLSDELARRSGDVVALAVDANRALPTLNARGDDLATLLEAVSRLSADLADVLEANRPFLTKNITEGGKALQLLADERAKIPGLVTGFRQFFQILAEVGGNEELVLPDGTRLAAVKLIFGGGSPCGRGPEGCPFAAGGSAQADRGGTTAQGGLLSGLPVDLPPLPLSDQAAAELIDLVGGILL